MNSTPPPVVPVFLKALRPGILIKEDLDGLATRQRTWVRRAVTTVSS